MKRIIILYLIISYTILTGISFEKLSDYAIAQTYWSFDNAIIEDSCLYLLSSYGLEIYQIDTTGDLIIQSRLPIMLVNSFLIKGNYAYIATQADNIHNLSGKICQINITDKMNPIIEQQLEFNHSPTSMNSFGDILYFYCVGNGDYINHFYSLPELNPIYEFSGDMSFNEKLSESTILRASFNPNSPLEIYNTTNPFNLQLIGTGNVSQIHPDGFDRVQSYIDTILIFSDVSKISFWNISAPYNWEYISTYETENIVFNWYRPTISDTKLIIVEFGYVELLDISNIELPYQLDIIGNTPASTFSISCAIYDNYVYLASNDDGICRLNMNDDILVFEEEIAEYYGHSCVAEKDNFLISGSSYKGIRYFDLTNPVNPIYIGELLPPVYNYYFLIGNDFLAIQRLDNFDVEIFYANDIENLTIRNIIDFDYYVIQYFDQEDDSAIYFIDQFNQKLLKYDISEAGNASLVIDEQLTFNPYWNGFIIKNGYGYFLEDSGNHINLHIYSNLENNDPVLCNTIYNIVQYSYAFVTYFEDMICLYTPIALDTSVNNTRVYDLQNPEIPNLAYELACFGKPYKNDEYIFCTESLYCYVFEPVGNPTGILEPIGLISDLNTIIDLIFVNVNDNKYLIMNEFSHFGIFEYNSSSSISLINLPASSLTNYPNPFNPSTTISFELTAKDAKNAKLEIYNIKCQKVKTLLDCKTAPGKYNCVWNGKDENGKRVSSGQYTARLTINGEEKAVRKMMVVK